MKLEFFIACSNRPSFLCTNSAGNVKHRRHRRLRGCLQIFNKKKCLFVGPARRLRWWAPDGAAAAPVSGVLTAGTAHCSICTTCQSVFPLAVLKLGSQPICIDQCAGKYSRRTKDVCVLFFLNFESMCSEQPLATLNPLWSVPNRLYIRLPKGFFLVSLVGNAREMCIWTDLE